MHGPAVANPPAPLAAFRSGEPGVPVDVLLLGVRVTTYAVINAVEHLRREAVGLGAVIDPALLDRLLDLPVGIPVSDPMVWVETADQPFGILERSVDGEEITRRLESPLRIADVAVHTTTGRELSAVQDASLFAGFTRRWVAAPSSQIPDAAMLEAKLCGVGILDPRRGVLLSAEKPVALTTDGWSWLLEEKTYRRWLSQRPQSHGTESPSPATDGASVTSAG
jgi:hypothetical protein